MPRSAHVLLLRPLTRLPAEIRQRRGGIQRAAGAAWPLVCGAPDRCGLPGGCGCWVSVFVKDANGKEQKNECSMPLTLPTCAANVCSLHPSTTSASASEAAGPSRSQGDLPPGGAGVLPDALRVWQQQPARLPVGPAGCWRLRGGSPTHTAAVVWVLAGRRQRTKTEAT